MHCVTRWSRFDVRWEGVPFTEVMKLVEREAGSALRDGPRGAGLYGQCAARRPDARPQLFSRCSHNGEPLPADHGYPVRLVVPHLYAWKSVKWVRGFEFHAARCAGLLGSKTATTCTAIRFEEQRFDSDRSEGFAGAPMKRLSHGPTKTQKCLGISPT